MLRQVRLAFALGASVLAVILVCPTVAAAELSWSGPIGRDTGGNGPALTSVACPTTTECVAVDVTGSEVTFNPAAPQPTPATKIDTYFPTSVACSSPTSCVAVDAGGQEVTFNPFAPAAAQAATVDPGQYLTSVACLPGSSSCVAVDASGKAVTFSGAQVAAGPFTIDQGQATTVSCPDADTCVAVDSNGTAVTFNPTETNATITTSQSLGSSSTVTAFSCPSTSVCAATNQSGTMFGFVPQGGTNSQTDIDSGQDVTVMACAGVAVCTLLDSSGGELAVVPGTSPQKIGVRTVISAQQLTAVACPSTTLCVAVDAAGHEISYTPGASPTVPSEARIDGLASYAVVACPSATQCTGIDGQGYEATFDPGSSAPPSTDAAVDPNGVTIYGISCPLTTQCTAVDLTGAEVTFNPDNPGGPTPVKVVNNHPLLAISCPSSTQCTAVDDDRYEATFNPQAPTSARYAALGTPAQASITGVSCPSVVQCTAVDAVGDAVTFNPQNPGSPKPTAVLSSPAVGVSCPTASRCVALDSSGDRVTFNPLVPVNATTATVDSSQPLALSCPSGTFCVAIDNANHAVEFDPGGTGATAVDTVGGSGSLEGLACMSPDECVIVDSDGKAFIGRGVVPAPPGALSAPRISGVTKEGRTLSEVHGRWSGPPTSYGYQWERCTTANSCRAIAGATDQTYQLTAADVGHLVRVTEQAADAGGFGPTVASATTRKVAKAPLPPSFSGVTVSGIAGGHPQLALTLTAAFYGPRLHKLTLDVAGGLSLHPRHKHRRWVGISVRVHSRPVSFSARSSRGALTISLPKDVSSLRLSLSAGALKASASLARDVRRHVRRELTLTVTIPAPGRGTLRGKDALRVS